MDRTGIRDYALLILRLAGLYLAVGHGWGKISALATGNGGWVVGMVAGLGFPLPAVFAWALAIAEFVGGICVALGLFTRVFAALPAFAMAVAVLLRHRAIMQLMAFLGLSSPTEQELDAAGSPEMATLYLIVLTVVLLLGPGRISLDQKLRSRRR